MKKNIMLAMIMVVAMLTGCGNKNYESSVAKAPVVNTTDKVVDSINEMANSTEDVLTTVDDTASMIVEDADAEKIPVENETIGDDNEVAENTEMEVKGTENIIMYSTTKVNVRNGAGTDYAIIGTLAWADPVTVTGSNGEWMQIDYNGASAYVNQKYLQIDMPVPAASINETVSDENLPSNTLCVGTAKEIFDATNAEREAAGLPALVWSDELAIAADIRAEEIIGTFSHVRPNGEKCYSLGSNIHGENIARGPHASGTEFVQHWMESEGHKANILRAEVFTAIGIGTRCTDMGDTAVQIFGTY